MKFKHFSYIDHQGTGLEVFSFLMPVDWKFEGGINWILDNPAMPATIPFRVYNTKGKDEFEAFANHCFFWTTSLQLLGMFPPGTKYFGSINHAWCNNNGEYFVTDNPNYNPNVGSNLNW